MDTTYKIGDNIGYIVLNDSNNHCFCCVGHGYIFYIDDKYIGVCETRFSVQSLNIEEIDKTTFIFQHDNNTMERMLSFMDYLIYEEEKEIKDLTCYEKDDLVKNEFNSICDRIKATANTMITTSDGNKFIDCLKEVCNLKKQLFSIKVSKLSNVYEMNRKKQLDIRLLKKLKDEIKEFDFDERVF